MYGNLSIFIFKNCIITPELPKYKEIPIEKFIQCVKTTLETALKKSVINCTIPALSYINIDNSNLDYCDNKEDALAVNGLIYKEAQKIQVQDVFSFVKGCPYFQ